MSSLQNQLVLLPGWYLVFLFSTVLHEAAHAWAAQIGGDDTAAEGGQVSLDPVPHIRREPVGMVLLPLASLMSSGGLVGWASAPFDPLWQRMYPHRAAWMAAAGPLANLFMVLVAAFLMHLGIALGFFSVPDTIHRAQVVIGASGWAEGAALVLSMLYSLNLLLCVLNLIPLPPLDGISVLGLFFREDTALKIMESSREGVLPLIGMVVVFSIAGAIYRPIFSFSLNLLYPWFSWGS